MENYRVIAFAIFMGALFVGGAIIASKLLEFRTPHSIRKLQAYECAEDPMGSARIQFKVGYYIFALLFLIFDVESLFLFPCMKIFRAVVAGEYAVVPSGALLAELGMFVAVLLTGLIYAWRKEALQWE